MFTPERKIPPTVYAPTPKHLPSIERHVLPESGITTFCLNPGNQSVSRITFFWPLGYADVKNINALEQLCAMLPEGSKSHSGAEIANILEYNGAWIKITYGRHNTMATIYLMAKYAEMVVPLFADILFNPTFPDDALSKIREAKISQCELQQRKVKTLSQQLGSSMIYGENAPAARHTTTEGLRSTSRADIADCYTQIMGAIPPIIFFTDNEYVKHSLTRLECPEQYKGKVYRNDLYTNNQNIVPQLNWEGTVKRVQVKSDSLQTSVRIIIPTIDPLHTDYMDLQTAVYVLGGYFGSRLMSNIREEKGYTYGISASVVPSKEGTNIIIQCETDNRFVDSVIHEISHEINRLAEEPISTDELRTAAHTAVSGLQATLDSPFSMLDYHIACHVMELTDYRFFLQQQRFLDATPDLILNMARKYLVNTPRAIALAGNPEISI